MYCAGTYTYQSRVVPAKIFDSHTGIYQPKNDIVKNLHRKRLYENWLRKPYRLAAVIKSYDRDTGQIEFAEQKSELSKYRILARLSSASRANPERVASLTKGGTFEFYGTLSAVEEPRWPSKVITFEFSTAEPLR